MTREDMIGWLHRRNEVLARFPAPAADASAEALLRHRRDGLAYDGNREFRPCRSVVRGVRGGVHEGMMSFGAEFAHEGDRWLVTSHMEFSSNGRQQTIVLGALRRSQVEALIEARLLIEPEAERRREEEEAAARKLRLIVDFGLTADAHAVACEIAAMRVSRTDPDRQPGPRDIVQVLEYAAGLVKAADTWTWHGSLRPENALSRSRFEHMTGTVLPRRLRETEAALAGPPPPGFVAGRLQAGPVLEEAVLDVCAALAERIAASPAEGTMAHLRGRPGQSGLIDAAALAVEAVRAYRERGGGRPDGGLESAVGAVAHVLSGAGCTAGEPGGLAAADALLRMQAAGLLQIVQDARADQAPAPRF